MRTGDSWQIQDAAIKFRCLKCKDQWEETDVCFAFTPILKNNADGQEEFFCFEVVIADSSNQEPLYLQDSLCVPEHMSVFGTTATSKFALPCLEFVKDTVNSWVSHEDSRKSHLTIVGAV